LDRILSVTLLEDLQIKAPLVSKDESIITYPDTSDISALQAREELLQLTTSGIVSKNKIEDPTPFHLRIKGSQIQACWTRPGGIHGFQGEHPQTIRYNQQKLVNSY
jgi:hypothetical protein